MNKGLQVLVVAAFCAMGAVYAAGGDERLDDYVCRYIQVKKCWDKQSGPVQAVVATASVTAFVSLLCTTPRLWRAVVRSVGSSVPKSNK